MDNIIIDFIVTLGIFILGCFIGTWIGPVRRLFIRKRDWLIVDQQGGRIMRQWFLMGRRVERLKDGSWRFFDNPGRLCHVPSSAFVVRIDHSVSNFLDQYNAIYNIPKTQKRAE